MRAESEPWLVPMRMHRLSSRHVSTSGANASVMYLGWRWSAAAETGGEFGGAWLQRHGLWVGAEKLGLLSRARKAASSLQMQSEEAVLASCIAAQTAALTV